MDNTVDCANCDGTGYVSGVDGAGDDFLDEPCDFCGGEGWVDEEEIDDEDID